MTPVSTLIDLLETHPQPRVRPEAINALTFTGEKAKPARDAERRASQSNDEYLIDVGCYLNFVLEGNYTPTSPVLEYKAFIRRMQVKPNVVGRTWMSRLLLSRTFQEVHTL